MLVALGEYLEVNTKTNIRRRSIPDSLLAVLTVVAATKSSHSQSEEKDTTPLITHRFALKDIKKAYEIFDNKLDGVIKTAVTTE